MKLLSRRPRSVRRSERGATLTGYGLLMAGIVVVSLGAIEAVNQSSQTVLGETATSVGTPRDSVSLTKTQDVGTAPAWVGARGPGTCTAGLDGCPLGTPQVPFTPQTMTNATTGFAPLDPGTDLTVAQITGLPDNTVTDQIFVAQESEIVLNGEWTPPNGDKYSAVPVTVQPGTSVCSFIVHVSSPNKIQFQADLQFQGEIIGTAYDVQGGSANNRKATNDTFASPDLTLDNTAQLGNGDKFSYTGNTLTIDKFTTNSGGQDDLRVFTRC